MPAPFFEEAILLLLFCFPSCSPNFVSGVPPYLLRRQRNLLSRSTFLSLLPDFGIRYHLSLPAIYLSMHDGSMYLPPASTSRRSAPIFIVLIQVSSWHHLLLRCALVCELNAPYSKHILLLAGTQMDYNNFCVTLIG